MVEDDPLTRRLLVHVLRHEQYRAVGVPDGKAALKRLRSRPKPGLLLLDLRMPVMSGWELLQVLKEDSRLRTVPVVVLSGDSFSGGGLGHAAAILEKPLNLGRLLLAVKRHFRGRG